MNGQYNAHLTSTLKSSAYTRIQMDVTLRRIGPLTFVGVAAGRRTGANDDDDGVIGGARIEEILLHADARRKRDPTWVRNDSRGVLEDRSAQTSRKSVKYDNNIRLRQHKSRVAAAYRYTYFDTRLGVVL